MDIDHVEEVNKQFLMWPEYFFGTTCTPQNENSQRKQNYTTTKEQWLEHGHIMHVNTRANLYMYMTSMIKYCINCENQTSFVLVETEAKYLHAIVVA